MNRYLVIYETGENGELGAYSPDLPGCVAVGESQTEVEQLMAEAIPMHIAAMREAGEPIPTPHHSAGSIAA